MQSRHNHSSYHLREIVVLQKVSPTDRNPLLYDACHAHLIGWEAIVQALVLLVGQRMLKDALRSSVLRAHCYFRVRRGS